MRMCMCMYRTRVTCSLPRGRIFARAWNVWRWRVQAPASIDFDHDVRPTYVDGDACVLRAPAVLAGDRELRPERVYLLRRIRNRFIWLI